MQGVEPIIPALVRVVIGLEKVDGVLELERLELDPRVVPPAMLELPFTPDDEGDESPVDDAVDELALTDDSVDVKGELEELPIPLTDVPDNVPRLGMHGLGVGVDTGGRSLGGNGLV